jgi:hypothetical protein
MILRSPFRDPLWVVDNERSGWSGSVIREKAHFSEALSNLGIGGWERVLLNFETRLPAATRLSIAVAVSLHQPQPLHLRAEYA